jgi:hypothetical protein
MNRFAWLKLIAAAGLVLGTPAISQVQTIDPNDVGEYEPAASQPYTESPQSPVVEEYVPIGEPPAVPAQQAPATPLPQASAEARASAAVGGTVAKDGVLSAAEGVFGRGAEGLAGVLESILKKQGEPTAYITGKEAGGAVVVGLRYGKGTLHHKTLGDSQVFWTGPSLGFDFGANADKVFVLVYNLANNEDIYTRFGAAEGNVHVVGGFTASYLRRGDVVLIPIRMGVGMRMGINAGYMRFSKKNRWLPF